MKREMKVNGTGPWSVHEEYVKDNYYARFHTHIYHCCSEMHFSSRLEVNLNRACSKSIQRPITMQGFILIAITAAEKCTIILDLT